MIVLCVAIGYMIAAHFLFAGDLSFESKIKHWLFFLVIWGVGTLAGYHGVAYIIMIGTALVYQFNGRSASQYSGEV